MTAGSTPQGKLKVSLAALKQVNLGSKTPCRWRQSSGPLKARSLVLNRTAIGTLEIVATYCSNTT